MTSVSRYPAGVKRTSSLESVHMYLLKFTYTWINSQDSSLRCPGGGSCVTAGLRSAWLIIFSLPVFSPANLPIQDNTAWFFLANQIFEDPQKITFPWLIRHVSTPRGAEEQVARRSTFWHKMVNLGDKFPDFEVDTSKGKIKFYDAMEGKWVITCTSS